MEVYESIFGLNGRDMDMLSSAHRAQKAPRPFESPCSLEWGAGGYNVFPAITQRHKFLFKPVVPLFHAFACLCGEFQYLKIRIDAVGILLNLCSIKVCIGNEVNLVYKEEGCLAEHKWVFKRLVIPFCGAQQHHLRIFAHIEFSRTDKVAHIFNYHKLYFRERQGVQDASHHIAVQMTCAACIYLHDRHACCLYLFGIPCCSYVTLYPPYPYPVFERIYGLFK